MNYISEYSDFLFHGMISSDRSLTEQADLDGDGKLDYTEFTQMMLWDLED